MITKEVVEAYEARMPVNKYIETSGKSVRGGEEQAASFIHGRVFTYTEAAKMQGMQNVEGCL
jgi:hypothetical protein